MMAVAAMDPTMRSSSVATVGLAARAFLELVKKEGSTEGIASDQLGSIAGVQSRHLPVTPGRHELLWRGHSVHGSMQREL